MKQHRARYQIPDEKINYEKRKANILNETSGVKSYIDHLIYVQCTYITCANKK